MQIPMDKMCKHQQLFDSRDAVVPPLTQSGLRVMNRRVYGHLPFSIASVFTCTIIGMQCGRRYILGKQFGVRLTAPLPHPLTKENGSGDYRTNFPTLAGAGGNRDDVVSNYRRKLHSLLACVYSMEGSSPLALCVVCGISVPQSSSRRTLYPPIVANENGRGFFR